MSPWICMVIGYVGVWAPWNDGASGTDSWMDRIGVLAVANGIQPMVRWRTRRVDVGNLGMGGDEPVRVQSMANTDTMNQQATVEQSIRLVEAGCELVRITAPSVRAAAALGPIRQELRRRGVDTPLSADIHFLPEAAHEAVRHVEKVRINPGNFADRKKNQVREYSNAEYAAEIRRIEQAFSPLVMQCKAAGVALRVGTNHGSLSDRIMNRYGDTPLGMVESAVEFLSICEGLHYHDVVLSMKASSTKVMVAAYRMLRDRLEQLGWRYPMHLGVTEAGDGRDGRVKSAVGIGALLLEGLGDTIRVSLTEDPVVEIPVARKLIELSSRHGFFPGLASLGTSASYGIGAETDYQYIRRPCREVMWQGVRLGGGQVPAVFQDASPEGVGVFELQRDGDMPVDLLLARPGVSWNGGGVKPMAVEDLEFLAGGENPGLPVAIRVWVDELESLTERLLSVPGMRNRPVVFLLEGREEQDAGWVSAHHALAHRLDRVADVLGCPSWPMILMDSWAGPHSDLESGVLLASARLGKLFLDGIGDGIWIQNRFFSKADAVVLSFDILQAVGMRVSKAEYVACPSCGRTMFQLEETTARIRARTQHLKGVKIGIMGCIVNGPGEMADADFGYVGSGPGRVQLFVGRECVERAIPEQEAEERLVALIRKHGRWIDPA